jgi:hypothetical protein
MLREFESHELTRRTAAAWLTSYGGSQLGCKLTGLALVSNTAMTAGGGLSLGYDDYLSGVYFLINSASIGGGASAQTRATFSLDFSVFEVNLR